MKKHLAGVSAIVIMSLGAMAQTSSNDGGVIIKGGVNIANLSITSNGRVDDARNITSFNVGVGLDLPLSQGLSLQPGLLLTGKGSKTQFGQSSDATYWKASTNPIYIELPVNIVGKIPVGGSSRIFVGVGPYAAMGVAGKYKVEGKIFGTTFNSEKNIDFSKDDPTTSAEENAGYGKLKRFDYGLNALAGIEFNRVSIGANYGYGLAKINSNTDNSSDEKGKNRVWSISLGFRL